jgi:hypothetical protein
LVIKHVFEQAVSGTSNGEKGDKKKRVVFIEEAIFRILTKEERK